MGATAPSGPVLVKVGGRALERDGAIAELAEALRDLEGDAVLVHGGGAEVSTWCEQLGRAPLFIDGRRVTDPVTLDIAVAVLAGLANKRMVAALRASGLDAVGLAALDGGVVEVAPYPRAAGLGAVGTIAGVAPALLETLLAQGRLPVLASIGACQGRLLNLNADDLAAALAGALRARALVLLSDAPGVILGGAVAPRLSVEEAIVALEGPDVTEGMRAKLEAACAALRAGVPEAHVAAWSDAKTLATLLAGEGDGTRLLTAEVCDV